MRKIVVDVRMLEASGIGIYLKNILPRIIDFTPDYMFDLLGRESEIRKYGWSEAKNVNIINCTSPIYSISEQLEVISRIDKKADLFWAPHYNIPLLYKRKLLVTIHDAFHLAMGQYVEGFHKKFYANAMFKAVVKNASKIICVSTFTKNELLRLTSICEMKIKTIHNGVDESWYNIEKLGESPNKRPFILYVGNVKPHKNLANLLVAFKSLFIQFPHDLIIVGKKDGFITGDAKIVAAADSCGDRVRFTGYIDEIALRQYYAYADVMVFPSFYEGFGLPPLEAMACGCPVVTSDAASLPEVCGEAAMYFNPHSPADIAAKVRLLLEDKIVAEDLRNNGIRRARHFTWHNCATQTARAMEEVLANESSYSS